jgi:hypothetical protein
MEAKSNKNLVGQPIFKQLLSIIPREKFDLLAFEAKTDHYYKTFSAWTQLTTMLFGIYSRCDSMVEVCDGMQTLQGKLNHIGLDSAPAKSTAGDGLRKRDNEFFKSFYFLLIEHFREFLSVSQSSTPEAENLFIFDSTTIRLFSDVMKGVGRNPKGDGKKKGGLKVHMLTQADSQTPQFVNITEGKKHDKTQLKLLLLPAFSTITFDRAYNDYKAYHSFSKRNIHFVGRIKSNANYKVGELLFLRKDNSKVGVVKEELIELSYKENNEEQTFVLKKVTFIDERKREFEFITNNLAYTGQQVADIYKKRWDIELLFKKLKQNYQLHYFYSDTENGIKTQIWCTLIAHLLLMILKAKTQSIKAFSTIAALIRIYLISTLDMYWMVVNCRRTYIKKNKTKNKGPSIQMTMF